jgi:(S)-2-hydroxy-acid oxidase
MPNRLLLRPRILRNVSFRNLKRMILGKSVSFPVGVSPVAFQSLAHPEAEIVNARGDNQMHRKLAIQLKKSTLLNTINSLVQLYIAAVSMGTIFVLSTFSNWSIEDIAINAPGGRKWFQLFPNTNKY